MGLGALFGGFGKNTKKTSGPGVPPILAPAPSAPMAAPAPPDATLAASLAAGQGVAAAQRIRRRAALGAQPVMPSSIATAASLQPKTLLGY
jgi:hypothetical protein